MSRFVPYPGGAYLVVDLEHVAGLSPYRTISLRVSPQALYALQNVALAEIADVSHYAATLAPKGYYRIGEEDEDEYALYLEIVSQVGLQLSEHLAVSVPLNFKDTVFLAAQNLNAAAGANTLLLTSPPTNEAYVIQQIAAVNTTSIASSLALGLASGGNTCVIHNLSSPPQGVWQTATGQWMLVTGQQIVAIFGGCQAGDDLYLVASGYKMEIIA